MLTTRVYVRVLVVTTGNEFHPKLQLENVFSLDARSNRWNENESVLRSNFRCSNFSNRSAEIFKWAKSSFETFDFITFSRNNVQIFSSIWGALARSATNAIEKSLGNLEKQGHKMSYVVYLWWLRIFLNFVKFFAFRYSRRCEENTGNALRFAESEKGRGQRLYIIFLFPLYKYIRTIEKWKKTLWYYE